MTTDRPDEPWARRLDSARTAIGAPRKGYQPQRVGVPLVANWTDPEYGGYYGDRFAEDKPYWGDYYRRSPVSIVLSYAILLTNVDVPLPRSTLATRTQRASRLADRAATLRDGSPLEGLDAARDPAASGELLRKAQRLVRDILSEAPSSELPGGGLEGLSERTPGDRRPEVATPLDKWVRYFRALVDFQDPHHYRDVETPSGGLMTIADYRIERCKPRWRRPGDGLEAALSGAAGDELPATRLAGAVLRTVGAGAPGLESRGPRPQVVRIESRPPGGPEALAGAGDGEEGAVAVDVETAASRLEWSCVERLEWFDPGIPALFANGPWLPDGPIGRGLVHLWGEGGILDLLPLFLGTSPRPRTMLRAAAPALSAAAARLRDAAEIQVGPYRYAASDLEADLAGGRLELRSDETQRFVVDVVSSKMPYTGD